MNAAVLGAKWSPCAEPMDQMVVPATGLPSASVQVKAVPPHSWTSMPRCRLYHAWSAEASFALKKMPPLPVTRFIETPRRTPRSLRVNRSASHHDRRQGAFLVRVTGLFQHNMGSNDRRCRYELCDTTRRVGSA